MSVRATISDSKSDFHKEFPYVIPPIYRKLADELLVELHLLSHQKNFNQNPIFCVGLKEVFSKFTNGYKPSEHVSNLFNAICNCNGFNPDEINSMAEQILNKNDIKTVEDLNNFLLNIKNENKDYNYYSRINAIGIYTLVCSMPFFKNSKQEEINKEIIKFSELLGYQLTRVEKDISLYKSNIEKMRQALEIIALNLSSK